METYADVYSFLKLHTETVELVDPEGPGRVLVAPDLAARVMTSSTTGPKGAGLGWINRRAFVSPPDPHFTNYGAEERLWLGPEGGQFSLYFAPDAPFDLEHWYVPKCFNEEPYAVVAAGESVIEMAKSMTLRNWSGTSFSLVVERTCRVLPRSQAASTLGLSLPDGVSVVAYETENRLINRGTEPMVKEKGLVSIWLLGMLNAGEKTAVLIPYKTDEEGGSGRIVTDDYFGKVPPDRLVVKPNCIVFRGDAKYRSKIGLSPTRCRDRLGSVDLVENILTVVTFSFAGDKEYVNSAWAIQEDPFSGDVVNSYNDGPPPGAEEGFGNFYELESSSPARELAPGESVTHVQRTYHFQGGAKEVDELARAALGAGVEDAQAVLG